MSKSKEPKAERTPRNDPAVGTEASPPGSSWGIPMQSGGGSPRGRRGQNMPKGRPPMVRKDLPPERTFGFETPPPPIPASDIKKKVTAEVVVVGAGLAGLCAALAAAESGARVVLIEKMSVFQARGLDNAFIGSRLQKKLGIEIDKDEVILHLMKYAANKIDQRLLRMWADGSGETADWLMDMTDAAGLPVIIHHFPPPPAFNNADEYYPQYHVTHEYQSEQPVAQCILDKALEKGVTVYYKTRARQLLRRGRGRVSGIVAQEAAGDYVQFNAKKAVILCTGDYSFNSEMMVKYCPQAAYMPSMTSTSTGDGHQMAMWIGAVMEPAPHAPINHGFAGPVGNAAFLQVNILGERFQNEDVPGQSWTNAVERQPRQKAWQVFDAKFEAAIPYMGIGHGKAIEITEGFRQRIKEAAVMADTIEELGKKMKVPVDTFKATVERYNELARRGQDLDFGKRSDRLTTIDTPPYYAGEGYYALLTVMGGLNVNTRLQALDKDWKPIPGLYLAGNTIGNRFAVDYPTICPGLSHGMAIHYGRVAGINAATLER